MVTRYKQHLVHTGTEMDGAELCMLIYFFQDFFISGGVMARRGGRASERNSEDCIDIWTDDYTEVWFYCSLDRKPS